MLKKVLQDNLKKCFLKIGFKENKGSDLAVNEWNFLDTRTEIMQNFNEVTINIEALFKRNDYEKILNKNDFLDNLKQYFVIESLDTEKVNNKRIKLILSLRQATCEV